ncbi:MAG: hypothetical protein EOP92_05715 [Lysobacteraceae bacterium]|nr:MAG: hypothetical protein EOP92_05715 [Xanthomonadaceae bacterium]
MRFCHTCPKVRYPAPCRSFRLPRRTNINEGSAMSRYLRDHDHPVRLAAVLALALGGCASAPPMDETRASIDAAQATLGTFINDPDMVWLKQHMHEAKAILVSPRILQAGFVVGASSGQAIVITPKPGGGGWNGPAFYRMTTGSVGLQAGAQSSEMVALIMTDKAVNSLLSTSFKLGADVSVAAGPIGAGTGVPVTADMVAYTRAKGLYGGLNLDGTVFSIDESRNHTLYGRTVTPVDILVNGTVSSPYAITLGQTATAGARAQ